MKNWYQMGALNSGEFRSALKRLQFTYDDVTWTEDKGWLSSVFYVKGDEKAITTLNQMVEVWQKENEKNKPL